MTADVLLGEFDRICEAPDAIPRLRRFILDLAVRGKLVPQDPSDESVHRVPLSGLQSSQAVTEKLPAGWHMVKVGELLNFQYGKPMPATDRQNVGQYPVYGSNGIVGYCAKPLCETPAIIIGRKGSAGALNLSMSPSWTTDVAYFVVPPSFLDIRFLFLSMQSLDLALLGKGVKPGLSRSDAYSQDMVVPPLAEQRRIVAKVDELMALCDQLEAARNAREEYRDALVSASLHRLGQPAGDAAADRDHTRFTLDHLAPLTTRPEHIKQLRQTILNLAVRGKLVPQDPRDEPAEKLLEQFQTERSRDEQGKARPDQQQRLEREADASLIPPAWRWVTIGEILEGGTQNGYSKKPDDAPEGVPLLRISAGTVRKDGIVAEEQHKLIGGITADVRSQYGLIPGDLLAVRFNGNRSFVGRLSLFTNYLGLNPVYPDKLIRIRLHTSSVLPKLVLHFAASDLVRSDIENYCATTVGNWGISAGNLKRVLIPLPPLAEQHRIVAKVDELMMLCDQLEAQLVTTETESRRLLEAVLHEALGQAV